jgi:hypothetical protein
LVDRAGHRGGAGCYREARDEPDFRARLDEFEQARDQENLAHLPARALRAAIERMQELRDSSAHALHDLIDRGGESRLERLIPDGHLGGRVDRKITGAGHAKGYADDATGIEIVCDLPHQLRRGARRRLDRRGVRDDDHVDVAAVAIQAAERPWVADAGAGRNGVELAKEPLRQAASLADIGGCLARQIFVVLRGHGSIARAQHLGCAALGFLDRFLVRAACGGSGIAGLHQTGQGGSDHRDRIRGDIASRVSRHVSIGRGADLAAGRRN